MNLSNTAGTRKNKQRRGWQWVKLSLLLGFIGGAIIWQLPVVQAELNAGAAQQSTEQLEFFEKKIRPIFVKNCQACHNTKVKSAGLDLSTPEGIMRGGDSGLLISKEQPESSRLLQVISYDSNIKMPPMGKLKADEIAALTAWMKMGAPMPGANPAAANWTKRKASREFTDNEKQFWAFQPIKDATPPAITNKRWAQSPVDTFVLKKLEEKNLKPAPQADKLTLLRRATFDLTGLPPTEQEIRDFLADSSANAFKKVVERLLASPRYGEQWGRHWLDVARYADSTGNDEDHRYPYAWKYRDYVIEAFNRDLPYDRFVREQIAGDLLPATDATGVNRQGIIATGFLALGPKAIAQQDKKKMLYDVFDEQVDVTSKAFLGLTISCARCHDHKFDPILTRDYYSLISIFASTRSFKNPDSHVSAVLEKPLVSKEEFELYQAQNRAHQAQVTKIRTEIEEIVTPEKERLADQENLHLANYMLAARKIYQDGMVLADVVRTSGLNEEIVKKWVEYLKPRNEVRHHLLDWENAKQDKLAETANGYQQRFRQRFTEWTEAMSKWRTQYQEALNKGAKPLPGKPQFEAGDDRFFAEVYFDNGAPFSISEKDQSKFSTQQWARLNQLQKELEELKKTAPAEPEMSCAIEEGERITQKVFIRGDYNNSGEDAPREFPLILARYNGGVAFEEKGSGRLELARWLTQPDHPLTARVMVNRLWQWHFGEGLVRTPDNFGKMGEQPTNPELLDYLAKKFVESGWSIKTMHRLIMLSSTYQMATENPNISPEADPENRLLTRFHRRRLAIEEMRDGLLAVDGTLDLTMGGTLQKGRGTDGETSNDRLSLKPETLKRRTVYVPLRRANLPTLLNLFDFGDATTASGKRQSTNVATQALFMLNSEFLYERSLNVAKFLLAKTQTTDAARLTSAYLRILGRQPDKEEITQGLAYIEGFKKRSTTTTAELDAWQSFVRVLMASNDFIYLD
jgi:hypothetical protein